MKLDVTAFRYITKDEFRVLTAVEMGMRNHELVPAPLVESIARISRGGCYKLLQTLLRNKLLAHDGKKYDGYRLTYHGYDYLALRALAMRGSIVAVGRRLGVGKESDVHFAQGPNGEMYALKLHRLGRISFRAIKTKRDYLRGREHASWMYMARLAAVKEFAYMKALADEGFPVPTPIDQNRHVVVMSFVRATPLYHLRHLTKPHQVLERLMRLIVRLARAGVVHGDFNEFNLMVDEDEKVTLIDFPQLVHTTHVNAEEFFDRDVCGVRDFFRKRMNIEVQQWPTWQEVQAGAGEEGSGSLLRGAAAVAGMDAAENELLVAAHEKRRAVDPEDRGEDEEEEEDEDDEDRETDAGDEGPIEGPVSFEPLLARGAGTEEEALEEAELLAAAEAAAAAPEGDAPQQEGEAGAARGDREGEGEEEGAESSDDEDSDGPGQLAVAGKRVRRKHTAKDAKKNLQRQQRRPPAKPNNQKIKETRRAKLEIREYLG